MADKTVLQQVKEALLAGATPATLETEGFNKSTIRVAIHHLRKEGLLTDGEDGVGDDKDTQPAPGPRGIRAYSRAVPVEALIDALKLPEGTDDPAFEQGMKFGMTCIVMGVKIAQELSSAGIQQARPLITMARDMRVGEKEAAKEGAMEAASKIGGAVLGELDPRLSAIEEKLREGSRQPALTSGKSPMQDMFARIMEPILKGVVEKVTGQFAEGTTPAPPSGWTVRDE